jgi:hypothetical protein
MQKMQRHAEDAEACRRCRGMQKMPQRHAEDAEAELS